MALPVNLVNEASNVQHGALAELPLKHKSIAEAKAALELLESAKGYHGKGTNEIHSQLEQLYADVVKLRLLDKAGFSESGFEIIGNLKRLYAMTFYAMRVKNVTDFEIPRQLLLSAMDSLLAEVALGYGDITQYSSLAQWAADHQKVHASDKLEARLVGLEPKEIVARTQGRPELQWMLASGLRFLGFCYQNIDKYDSPSYDRHFDVIYGAAGDLLIDLKSKGSEALSKRATTEQVELVYNTTMAMHYRIPGKDGDIAGAWEKFKVQLISKDTSSTVLARIHNLFSVQYVNRGMDFVKQGKTAEAVNDYMKALEFTEVCLKLYDENNVTGFDLANAQVNKGGTLVKLWSIGVNQTLQNANVITELFRNPVNYMKGEIGAGRNHVYFPLWERTMAPWPHFQIEFMKNQLRAMGLAK